MANPNKHDVSTGVSLKRDTYDLSHSNHFTGKIGQLIPVMWNELVPGDTFHISPNFNVRFAPTSQPLQNRIKCVIDYFFVPFKAIWKNQNAFFNQGMNNTEQPPAHPFLQITPEKAKTMLKPSTLLDYLGVPTFIGTKSSVASQIPLFNQFEQNEMKEMDMLYSNSCFTYIDDDAVIEDAKDIFDERMASPNGGFMSSKDYLRYSIDNCFDATSCTRSCLVGSWLADPSLSLKTLLAGGKIKDVPKAMFNGLTTKPWNYCVDGPLTDGKFYFHGGSVGITPTVNTNVYLMAYGAKDDSTPFSKGDGNLNELFLSAVPQAVGFAVSGTGNSDYLLDYSADLADINAVIEFNKKAGLKTVFGFFSFYKASDNVFDPDKIGYFSPTQGLYSLSQKLLASSNLGSSSYNSLESSGDPKTYHGFRAMNHPSYSIMYTDGVNPKLLPLSLSGSASISNFLDSNHSNFLGITVSFSQLIDDTDQVAAIASSPFVGNRPVHPINALVPRAYTCCGNFFYRNKDIDYLRQDANGNQTDAFQNTTRVVDQFLADNQMKDGADSYEYKLMNALLEKDMFTSCFTEPLVNYHPLIGIRQKDNSASYDFAVKDGFVTITAEDVTTQGFDVKNAKVTSYGTSLLDDEISALKDMIATGITTADIRHAQALQRWISNKVQKGYNFTEQQLAQFGINSHWNPLTAPQYLGSAAQWVNNGMLVSSDKDEMGLTAGLPIARSEKENRIVCHASERGFVMGIMRVVPIPVYTQAMPAGLAVPDYTEYFQPEFDNKGYEVVKNSEIAPILANIEGKIHEPFGYNVGWHRYKSAFDQMHGDVSINFRNIVMKREFSVLPTLSRSFIECRAEDYDNVFNITKQGDKFIAEIFHSIKAERPMIDYQSRV